MRSQFMMPGRPGRLTADGPARFAALLVVPAVLWSCGGGCHRPEPSSPRSEAAAAAWFADGTAAAGIRVVHDAGDPSRYEMPQIMGSGAGIVDVDADGRTDLYFVGGSGPEPVPGTGVRDRIYRRTAAGVFVDVTAATGVKNAGFGMGVAAGDYDNDGFADLLVTSVGPDQLFRGNGDGTFDDVTAAAAVDRPGWGTAACFGDYDRDGDLDLFVADYVDYFPGQYCEDRGGRRDFCGPAAYPGTADCLLRNEGDGRFADVSAAVGIDADPGKGLGVACRDFDGDGRPDFYVANDMEANHLWMQQPDGTFRNEAVSRGAAFGEVGEAQASMGVVAEDLTGDGRCDLFLTHLRGETNTLYVDAGGGFFESGTVRSGLGPPSRPATGFGVAAVDLRNDGRLHVLVANGRVQRAPPLPGANPDSFWSDYAEPGHLYVALGSGRYELARGEAGPFSDLRVGRALAVGDLDDDGDLDLVSTSCGGPARIFENVAPDPGHRLLVRPIDTRMNRDAIGSTVAVVADGRRTARVVDPNSGYLTANDARVHFGLGSESRYDRIEVTWTDGVTETFPGGRADGVVTTVRRSAGQRFAREEAL